ncbi:hypothetical protein M0802_014717 [Mischocyttarus mexicanus]|nr:hypothetical protein M0802_014717 [Mischocyttarus mexicanus]
MFRISRKKELLQKINNISKEHFETDSSQSESEDQLNDSFGNDEFDSDYEDDSSTTDEEENNLNASRRRKRMRLLTDSENDTEESSERQNTETAVDETVWEKIKTRFFSGRSPVHTTFKGVSSPTGHAKRNVMSGKVILFSI